MAILLPTRTSLPALEKALAGRGIPYRVESRSLVWATDAVRDVDHAAAGRGQPGRRGGDAGRAAPPRPGLLRRRPDRLGRGRRAVELPLTAAPDGIPAEHPVAAGMAALQAWHDLRWWLPVNQLVDRIVRELRLVELTAELRRPRDHWRRLRFVIDQARAFCDAGGSGLSDFVAWAVDQIESRGRRPRDGRAGARRRRGAHPHRARLQGPGVPGDHRRGARRAAHDRAPRCCGGGCSRRCGCKRAGFETAAYAEQQAAEKALDQAEAVRLLYVAMTRAKD